MTEERIPARLQDAFLSWNENVEDNRSVSHLGARVTLVRHEGVRKDDIAGDA